MLEQVLASIKNYFIAEIRHGTYTIENGGIELPFLRNGQYFRVMGSVFNDGVYQYPADALTDETFDGAVWALAIPKGLRELVTEIEAWQSKYGAAVDSPYQSESFGGYSYTKASGGSGSEQRAGWEIAFSSRLNQWRKVRVL